MNVSASSTPFGRVASLHLHPEQPGAGLQAVESFQVVVGRGVLGDNRYFGRLSRDSGQPTRRQVTLIEREQIAEHATALGLANIPPGAVRANIETTGLSLIALLGREVEIGEARLSFYAPRDPCAKMDAICQGLRERMLDRRQGVLAQVTQSGQIRIGDPIRLVR